MATLLHLDSSLNGDNSVSRAVTASFREGWEAAHPEGTVVYRDLSAEPLPHLGATTLAAGATPAEDRTPEQHEAAALREKLVVELEEADAVVVGAPLYNYGIASTLKAWIDHVFVMNRTTGEDSTVAGTPITVVTSRGGSYRPGTPREHADFVIPYLRFTLGQLGLTPEFIVAELTLARSVPAMSELIGQADASRTQAHEEAGSQGRALAGKLAGASVV